MSTEQALTLEQVRSRRREIEQIAATFGAHELRVFGSVARGDADLESDLDLLVDLASDCRGLDYFALIQDLSRELEALLGHRVDVVRLRRPLSLRGEQMARQIESEAVAL